MRNRKVITPVLDWQMHKNIVDNPETKESKKEMLKIAQTLIGVCMDTTLYHVDGDEGENEHLHFQFVMVDPELFYKMARAIGMKHIEGYGDLKDLIDMFNREHDDDDKH